MEDYMTCPRATVPRGSPYFFELRRGGMAPLGGRASNANSRGLGPWVRLGGQCRGESGIQARGGIKGPCKGIGWREQM